MIGVIIPAHNEEDYLPACLNAVKAAALSPQLDEEVRIIVVLDRCSDKSAAIVELFGVQSIPLQFGNVGMARAAGAKIMLQQGARWLAFTDADTVVSPEWLSAQVSLGYEAVCGSVGVDDWTPHGRNADLLRCHFLKTYNDNDGHRHIHGANLGLSANAYQLVGGFQDLACSEDVALVQALESHGIDISWSSLPRVSTSARIDPRAKGGFGDTLLRVISNTVEHVNVENLSILPS